jgi:ectoine hydroxylase-related dioxygenase (phytanoyl-CoA dioxygenase family)
MSASWRSCAPGEIRDHYDRDGYFVVRQAISPEAIDGLQAYMEREIYPEQRPLLRHPTVRLEPHSYETAPDGARFVRNGLYNPHLETATAELGNMLLALICSGETADFLQIIDGDRQHTLHQIIMFFTTPGTDPHIDGWAIDTETPGDLCTLWIPLERVTLLNGPICVFPWRRGDLLLPESLGVGNLDDYPEGEAYGAYHDALSSRIDHTDRSVVVPLLAPGDLVVFASTTPHASMPPRQNGMMRRALQVMVRPTSSRWGGILMSRLRKDESDVLFNDRWILSMSQRRRDQ